MLYTIPFYTLFLSYWLIQYLRYKDASIFQHKIKNFWYSFSICFLYIILYLFLLYMLRSYALNLNLKSLVTQLYFIFIELIQKPKIEFIFIIIDLISLLLFFLLLIISLDKFCINHFYKIYFYYQHYDLQNFLYTYKLNKFQLFNKRLFLFISLAINLCKYFMVKNITFSIWHSIIPLE